MQRNVRSTFQADIHPLNFTWMSPACVCSFFFLFLEYLLAQFENEFSEKIILLSWIPRMKQHIHVGSQATKGGMQKLDRFWPKINGLKGNYCYFVNRHSAKLSKSVTVRLSFSMNHLNLSVHLKICINLKDFFFHFLKQFIF